MLDRRSNINAQDDDGRTALMYALYPRFDGQASGYSDRAYFHMSECDPGSETMVQLLVHKKADINAVDKFGYTSLMYAVGSAQPLITRILLDSGANVDIQCRGETVFDLRLMGRKSLANYPHKKSDSEKVKEILRAKLISVLREGLEATSLTPDTIGVVIRYICGEKTAGLHN